MVNYRFLNKSGEKEMINGKHKCGYPFLITTTTKVREKRIIFIDDNADSESFGDTITVCPKCGNVLLKTEMTSNVYKIT